MSTIVGAVLGTLLAVVIAMIANEWAERVGMRARIRRLEADLLSATRDCDAWRAKALPHEAARAEWRDTKDENRELRAAKATLRRRLRGVLRQARAWKRAAVAYGWHRGDKAAPGALCACDEWRGPAHMAGCKYGRGEGGEP